MKIEIGSGENPDLGYDIHTDMLSLPHVECICPMDKIPYPDATFDGLRANDVLEHQSWELIKPTLLEWNRVLKPGADVFIQVPNGRHIILMYAGGMFTIELANYYLMGGHTERSAYRGVDANGLPLWIWNAHHTFFDDAWLKKNLEETGFTNIQITANEIGNLECRCNKL